jgi:formate hydrogenlyase subunit 6/NADH:ubiquinone oxidoreductase subunit I
MGTLDTQPSHQLQTQLGKEPGLVHISRFHLGTDHPQVWTPKCVMCQLCPQVQPQWELGSGARVPLSLLGA